MFTHFGVTGPLILTASSVCARKIREKAGEADPGSETSPVKGAAGCKDSKRV